MTTRQTIVPIPQIPDWTRRLIELSRQPLEFCPNFPRIAQRFEAWWHQQALDRPILIASSRLNVERAHTRRLELMNQPELWLKTKIEDCRNIYRLGDALPTVRADFGPVLLGSLVGGKTEIASDTTWTHSFINDDWSNAPSWNIIESHPWWSLLKQLLAISAEAGQGRFLVCTPDLGGSADVLLNLRGSTELCTDVIEQPQKIVQAIDALYHSWRQTYIQLYEQTLPRGAGVVHWHQLWSNQPYMIPACDFNYMIGPEDFNQLLLPDIARQAGTAGRAIFHLDGAGAARHIDALLELPELDAIQYTPGAGTPSALAWLDMFKLIQSKKKSVLIFAPAEEVPELCRQLKPEGLAINFGESNPQRLDQLYAQVCKACGVPASRD